MLKKSICFLWMPMAVVCAKPVPSKQVNIEMLSEDIVTLRNEINNLSGEVRSLKKDIEVLQLSKDTLSDAMSIKIRQMIEDECRDYDSKTNAVNRTNELADSFNRILDDVTNMIRTVLNHIIVTLNEQYRRSSLLNGTVERTPQGIAYEVRAGETLEGIAKKYSTTKETLKSMNFIMDENHLPEGQMLFIPQTK